MSQLLWPTLGYSLYLGLPPAAFKASTMSCERFTGTAVSASPWNTQVGMFLILSASFVLPPPQMGTIAAQRSGNAAAMLQVPYPPMDRPVRYWRFASVLYSFIVSSRIARARLPSSEAAPQVRFSDCGMTTMNG